MSDILPTLILIGLVYALYRWLTGPKTPSDPLRNVKREMVDAVTSAFPHVPIEAVVYSLSRTRSAQTTSEIILERGSLPQPPAGFTVPDRLRPASSALNGSPSAAAAGSSAASAAPAKKAQSLIDRYNLSSKLSSPASSIVSPAAPAAPEAPACTGGGKWEANREDREKELRARKERMILEARRRMLEKQKAAESQSQEGKEAVKVE